MGGVVDAGPQVDTKKSPRHMAIEKAQAALRDEYSVRDERKRELEYLEKGGNPLDFKFGSTSSVSVQSTSVTDRHRDLDAKGSSAVATSPHGDSEDSGIRPGANLGRDSTTADNLLFTDSTNENHEEDNNELRPGKRRPISSEHPSKMEGSNIKESDESGSFRFGVKSQAYARRNRSRTNRESIHIASARAPLSTNNGNELSSIPSSSVDSQDKKEMPVRTQGEENAVSPVSDSGPSSPCDKVISRDLGEGDVVQGETNGIAFQVPETDGQAIEAVLGKDSIDQTTIGAGEDNLHRSLELITKESVSACAANAEPGLPVDNIDKSGSTSSNVSKPLDIQLVEEELSLVDIKRESSSPHLNHVSSESIRDSPFPAESELIGDRKDAKTMEVKSFADGEHDMTVDADLLCSDRQLKSEQTYEFNFSLNIEQQESTKLKEKESGKPSSDSIIISKPSEPAQVNNSLATSDGTINPETKSSEKVDEDELLKEARIIEAKMRRASELSCRSFQSDKRQKSHWDYLLEEMAWLANDFTQERSWKIAAAFRISHGAARAACLSSAKSGEQKKTAHSLAKAVISFWELAEGLHSGRKSIADMDKVLETTFFVSKNISQQECAEKQNSKDGCFRRPAQVRILDYAVRFLECNWAVDRHVIAEAPLTPDRTCDSAVLGMPWDDQSSEETLFYTVPAEAMKVYRESIESQWPPLEDISYTTHREEFEASTCDSLADYGSYENTFEDDEAETPGHYLSGPFERSKFSKFSLKKNKFFQDKNHNARSFDGRPDLFSGSHLESKISGQPSLLLGKRVTGAFSGSSIPTKRVRTASRQRVISPFGIGNSNLPVNSKNDASSGDTSSFQDDQASLHGESNMRNTADIESTADFGRRMLFNGSEGSIRPKKKKKQRHMGYRNLNSSDGFSKVSSYDQRWQDEPTAQNDQKDPRKRVDGHHFGSFGNPGQHAGKRPKLMRHLSDASPDMILPMSASHASPAASQFSSMPTTNKLIKLITNRDRNKKGKGLKMSGGQVGSGCTWSQFEDQALVVLVHDMGTNWELVSDTINSTLQFKCIFRKPIECKERHKVLMERSAGDGADSAEDSGSSQSYPSTLPGIPKGSARQLFQRLQGPMEEDTLKSHFEKIIAIGRQLHFRRNQAKIDSKEMKLITQVHSSHIHALTQACPSSLTGTPLTPLDLAEVTQSPEPPVHGGFQGSHSAAPPLPSHPSSLGPTAMGPSGGNSLLPASANLSMSGSLSSPSAPQIGSARDPRYSSPRPSFPVDEQQRMQQYSQMMASRATAQSPGMSSPGSMAMGIDRGVRMISGGSSWNNGISVPARPGLSGIGSPGMLNAVTSGAINAHPNAAPGQGNSLPRPRDLLQQVQRPQNPEDHKLTPMQEAQLPSHQPGGPMAAAAAGPSQPVPPFTSPHLFGGNSHHHPHQLPSQHPAYAVRYAKDRQHLQQRLLQHPQQTPPGSPAQHARPQQGSPRISSPAVSGANPRPRPHHQQALPQRHHLHQPQQRPQTERVFSGVVGVPGQQKAYPRAPSPNLRPPSQQAVHRMVLQQNNSLIPPPEASAVSVVEQGPDKSGAASSASVGPAAGPGSQWRPDSTYETQGLSKRQFSGLPGGVNAIGPQSQLRPPLQSGSFGLPSKPS